MSPTDSNSDHKTYLSKLARSLEEPGTLARLILWIKLSCGRVPGFKFVHDHPVAGYVVDFYCPAIKLGIDIETNEAGGGKSANEARRAAIEAHGIVLLTFTDEEIRTYTDEVLEHIQILATAFGRMSRTGS